MEFYMRIRRFMPLALALSLPLAACSTQSSADDQPQMSLLREMPVFAGASPAALADAEERSMRHLQEVQPELLNGVDAVWTKRVSVDRLGEAHTRVTQTVDNIPVFGGEAIVHLRADGSFKSMTDSFVRNVGVDTKPVYKDFQAIDLAVDSRGGWAKVTGTPEADLQIVRKGRVDHLTYRVQIDQFEVDSAPSMPVVFIDAHTGAVVDWYDDLKTSKSRKTYTANNGTSLPGTLKRSEGQAASGDSVLDQAHDNAGLTWDYYNTTYTRDSYDNAGATITSTVHYSTNYVNAYWNNVQMVYGDGDGSQSGPLTVLDVVAHELTHAVTSNESNLTYSYESGALNEAMSDIFGASVEAYRDGGANANTWKIGEECWTPGTAGDALRYMNDPALANNSDYYPDRYTGSSDNGGVHTNSGIANLAFYLFSQGGTHPRNKTTFNVPAIGSTRPRRSSIAPTPPT
jgi:vibriolysin